MSDESTHESTQKFADPDARVDKHMPVVVKQGDGPHDYTMQCTCGHVITLEGELRRLGLKEGDLIVYRGDGDEMLRFCRTPHPELPRCPVLFLRGGNDIERHSREEIVEEAESQYGRSCMEGPGVGVQPFIEGALWMRDHLVKHREPDK